MMMPMFPLGSPLLPHMVLPLHVFEPRYRTMTEDVLAATPREFGVVMIERGHEVGGGDVRSTVGTVARVLEAQEQDDGRWLMIAVGTRRIRVERWMPEDPYPCAEVRLLDEPLGGSIDQVWDLRGEVAPALRRVLALASELGHDLPNEELDDDPTTASYQASILAPLSAFDKYRLLAAETVADRYRLLVDELAGLADVLEYRLSAESTDLE